MSAILAALVLVVVSIVLWGVGAAVLRLTGSQAVPWPVSIGIGLSATIAAGGLLNLAHIAYRPTLWILAGIELAISLFELRRIRFKFDYDLRDCVEIASAAIAIGLATLFAISTQLPPKAFNSHDDFEKYFAYPVRMLATGTLRGSPLSALGSEALGGQSFLHGLVLSVLPIGYINGVDAIFSFAVLMCLTASAGWRRFSWFPGALIGPCMIVAINPQYVNVSALYTGALLVATAVMLVADDRRSGIPAPVPMGLVYAGAMAVKPTFAIFVACHLPLAVLAVRIGQGSLKPALVWCRKTMEWTSLCLAPWVLLHIPNYLGHRSFGEGPVPSGFDGELNLLSTKTFFYGASFLDYTEIALLTAVIGIFAAFTCHREIESRMRHISLGIVAGTGAGVLSYLITVLALGRAFGYAQSLRLAIPSILGACVASIVLSPSVRKNGRHSYFLYLPLVASIVICASFAPSMVSRYRQAARYGSILAFSDLAQSADYATFNRFWLSDMGKQYIRQIQDRVPQGEPLLAWINTPFLLDYKRNAIVDADTVGIASPWATVPDKVQYVLWQYQGPEVRRQSDLERSMHGPGYRDRMTAARTLAFSEHLSQVAEKSEVIATDGYFVLFRFRGSL
jgi:hypothetical protein